MKTIVLILAGLVLSSCGDRTPLQFQEQKDATLTSEIDFVSVKKIIIGPKCVSCHRQYDTYSGVTADLDKIMSAVESERMPKNSKPLSDTQKEFLRKWVALGAPAGEQSQPDDNGELKATWTSLSAKVFGSKCIQCHNPAGEAKFLDLSSREAIWKEREKLFNFDDPAASYFITVISDPEEPMPPVWSGLPRLEEKEIEVLKKWIGEGLP